MRTAAPADLFCLFALRYFTRRFAARGYPPSDMPDLVEQYSQRGAVDDALPFNGWIQVDAETPE